MSLAEVPRPHLPSAPSPDTFDLMMDDLIAEALKAKTEYRWFYPSAYSKGRKGGNEKTRRDVSGVGGGIDEIVAGGDPDKDGETTIDGVKRHLQESGDHARRALAQLKGAGKAHGRAQEKIDRASKPTLAIALNPLDHEPDASVKVAREYQVKRAHRAADSQAPWAAEEITG